MFFGIKKLGYCGQFFLHSLFVIVVFLLYNKNLIPIHIDLVGFITRVANFVFIF